MISLVAGIVGCHSVRTISTSEQEPKVTLSPQYIKDKEENKLNLVLDSDPAYGNGYFAFVTEVPPTRFFRIVRAADCDGYIFLNPLAPRHPVFNYDVQRDKYGRYTGNSIPMQCLNKMKKAFASGDPVFEGADGGLYYVDDASASGTLVSSLAKGKMKGWAIKFDIPSHEEIIELLSATYRAPHIYSLQLSSLFFYLQNEGSNITPENRELYASLIVNSLGTTPPLYDNAEADALKALAAIDPDFEKRRSYWWKLTEQIVQSPLYTNSPAKMKAFDVATNVLFCNPEENLAERTKHLYIGSEKTPWSGALRSITVQMIGVDNFVDFVADNYANRYFPSASKIAATPETKRQIAKELRKNLPLQLCPVERHFEKWL